MKFEVGAQVTWGGSKQALVRGFASGRLMLVWGWGLRNSVTKPLPTS